MDFWWLVSVLPSWEQVAVVVAVEQVVPSLSCCALERPMDRQRRLGALVEMVVVVVVDRQVVVEQ